MTRGSGIAQGDRTARLLQRRERRVRRRSWKYSRCLQLQQGFIEVIVTSRIGKGSFRRMSKMTRFAAPIAQSAEASRDALLRERLWRGLPKVAVAWASLLDFGDHSPVRPTYIELTTTSIRLP